MPSSTAHKPKRESRFFRDWESNIDDVMVESCKSEEDPLGYKAVYFLAQHAARESERKSFVIGASFLAQRKESLQKAGYRALMTNRAISLIEERLGRSLLDLDDDRVRA